MNANCRHSQRELYDDESDPRRNRTPDKVCTSVILRVIFVLNTDLNMIGEHDSFLFEMLGNLSMLNLPEGIYSLTNLRNNFQK